MYNIAWDIIFLVPLHIMNPDNILSQLNESQAEAVCYTDGAQLVIAGAGSGKTRVLTYKIAYLLQQGLEPWSILALTFTNKAATEMKERIAQIVGEQKARYLDMGTFHSVFSHILRRESAVIGYDSNFTIYDQSDSRSLVKAIIKEMKLDDKTYKPAVVADRISMAKNHLILPAAYRQSTARMTEDARRQMPKTGEIYEVYCRRCRAANAMDFDDLLVNTFLLFNHHPDVLARYEERYKYVLVDEYQDTNKVQQQIVWLLTRQRQKICVVGDDAQSIYSFRGANIDNILDFNKLYDNVKLCKLEQNYRSTQLIVEAANSLISHNTRQIRKQVFSQNEKGEKIKVKNLYSDREEAKVVCDDIRAIKRQQHCRYSDFAILYRTNSQSRAFEEQMIKEAIPYIIYGGLSFYQRKEIKDVIAYFRLIVNVDDEEAFKRIVNYPARGIGDTTLSKLMAYASSHGISLWHTISCSPEEVGISRAAAKKLVSFADMIESWRALAATEDAYTLGKRILAESGMNGDIFKNRDPESLSRQENIEEFVSGLQEFVDSQREEGNAEHVSLEDFIRDVSLMTDMDSSNANDGDRVVLMTVHSAKGLEFPTVFIVGMEENIFPSLMSMDSPRELEEERRLFYVAITRAEHRCIISCVQNRFRYGRMEFQTPSRFINDINPKLIDTQKGNQSSGKWSSYGESRGGIFGDNGRSDHFSDNRRYGKPAESIRYGKPADNGRIETSAGSFRSVSSLSSGGVSSAYSLSVGDMIEHLRFGIGRVIAIEGDGENTKATVEFSNLGTKQLLLKFAKFKKLT